jgi:hypothetical protein
LGSPASPTASNEQGGRERQGRQRKQARKAKEARQTKQGGKQHRRRRGGNGRSPENLQILHRSLSDEAMHDVNTNDNNTM